MTAASPAATHEVFNQSTPWADVNLFTANQPLQDALRLHAPSLPLAGLASGFISSAVTIGAMGGLILAMIARVTLGHEDAGRFLSGMRRRGPWADCAQVAVYADHPAALLGTAQVEAGELIPGRLLSPIEIQHILESHS